MTEEASGGVKLAPMNEAPRPVTAPASILSPHIVTVETIETAPERRPASATIDGIAELLAGPPGAIENGAAGVDAFAWSLVAAGLPLLRVTLHVGTIHPQFLGTTVVWWRDTGRTTRVLLKHEVADVIPYGKNPVRRVCEGRETLRRRLDRPDAELDFEVLRELRERGGTDYLALPIASVHATAYMVTFVTDRAGGQSGQPHRGVGQGARPAGRGQRRRRGGARRRHGVARPPPPARAAGAAGIVRAGLEVGRLARV